jgi:hypothetical protein
VTLLDKFTAAKAIVEKQKRDHKKSVHAERRLVIARARLMAKELGKRPKGLYLS